MQTYDYYWRDYTGAIPEDAVEGGLDANQRTTYIGQVYLKNSGLIPVTIYPGKRTVTANILKIHHLNTNIKILCSGHKKNFKWIKANSKNIYAETINKHLVKGGVEWDEEYTNIGRIAVRGELLVAKLCRVDDIGNAKLWFPDGNRDKYVEHFEVLVYDLNPTAP